MLTNDQWRYLLSIIAALVIVIDFGLPGKEYKEEVIKVEKTLQLQYNAAQDIHFTYKVFAGDQCFYVSEEFGMVARPKDQLRYSVSYIFHKINRYKIEGRNVSETYSLRWATGFFCPLLVILIMIFAFWYSAWLHVTTFVMHVILIVDLIFLTF